MTSKLNYVLTQIYEYSTYWVINKKSRYKSCKSDNRETIYLIQKLY